MINDIVGSALQSFKNFQSDMFSTSSRRSFVVEMTLRIYSVLGIIIFVFSISYFALVTLNISLSSEQKTSLALSGLGLALFLMATLGLKLRADQQKFQQSEMMSATYSFELIDAWNMFESAGREILSSRNERYNKFSIRAVISNLHEEETINDLDVEYLQEALELRNIIVHSPIRAPIDVVKRSTIQILDIISRMTKNQAKQSAQRSSVTPA